MIFKSNWNFISKGGRADKVKRNIPLTFNDKIKVTEI